MSNVSPFVGGEVSAAASQAAVPQDAFKPDLEGFNWGAYEGRQERIDAQLQVSNAEQLGVLISQLHQDDNEVGVKLNNLHNTTIGGLLPRGLNAQLSVISRTTVNTDARSVDFRGAVAPEARFEGHDYTGSDFTDAVLPRASFRGSNLRGVSFVNVVLSGADFEGAILQGADFRGAYLVNVEGLTPEQIATMNVQAARVVMGARAEATSLEQLLATRFGSSKDLKDIRATLDPVPVSIGQTPGRLQSNKIFRGLLAEDMTANQVDFTASDLTGSTFERLVAKQASFRAATISGAIFRGAIMREVDMVSTWAPGVVYEDVDMLNANVTNANLVGSVFSAVDMRGMVGLDAEKTNLNGVVIDEDCLLPQGYGFDGVSLQRSEKLKKQLEQ